MQIPTKQIIVHKTIVEDEEFNNLVDENENLKMINKQLVDKANYMREIINSKSGNDEINLQKDFIIKQQKEEIIDLNKKFNKIYFELNQYKDKNYELNCQITDLQNEINEMRNYS